MIQSGVYGIQNYGVQRYLPIAERRELAPTERAEVKQGLKQWWPKIGAGYSTPMYQLLASPSKSAVLWGGGFGLFGALVSGSAILKREAETASATAGKAVVALGTGIFGLLGAFLGYISRRQQNENILDLMGRFPFGATKRDMLSDPVYQSDLNRSAMIRASRYSNRPLYIRRRY
jgi:hypothetical protein